MGGIGLMNKIVYNDYIERCYFFILKMSAEGKVGHRYTFADYLKATSYTVTGRSKEAEELIEQVYSIDNVDYSSPLARIAKRVLQGFLTEAFDPGLMVERSFDYAKPPQAAPVSLLHRTAFIEQVIQDEAKKKLERTSVPFRKAIFMLDIANLRGADQAVDKHGNKAADWMLNNVGKLLRNVVDGINKSANQSYSLHLGRYGGDEFSLALVGDYTDADIQNITAQITAKITDPTMKGYYKGSDGVIQEGPISFKNKNKIEAIKVESGTYDGRIFDHFFAKGLILDQKQIDRIKRRFKTERAFEGYASTHARKLPHITADQLCQLHPELRGQFYLAQYLDTLYPKQYDEKSREQTLFEFITNVKYDRLLDEDVPSLSHFKEHFLWDSRDELENIINTLRMKALEPKNLLKTAWKKIRHDPELEKFELKQKEYAAFPKNVEEVWMFDIKVKEVNTVLSYADGDEVIRYLWQKIYGSIAESDRDKVLFMRRGGVIGVAVRKQPPGKTITDKTREALDSLHNLNAMPSLFDEKQKIDLPLGVYHTKIRDFDGKKHASPEKWADEEINRCFEGAENDFYRKVIDLVVSHDSVPLFTTPQGPSESVEDKLSYTLVEFIHDFFLGKRAYERSSKVLDILNTPAYQREECQILKQVMGDIQSGKIPPDPRLAHENESDGE